MRSTRRSGSRWRPKAANAAPSSSGSVHSTLILPTGNSGLTVAQGEIDQLLLQNGPVAASATDRDAVAKCTARLLGGSNTSALAAEAGK